MGVKDGGNIQRSMSVNNERWVGSVLVHLYRNALHVELIEG